MSIRFVVPIFEFQTEGKGWLNSLHTSLHRYAMHYLEDVIGVVDQQAAHAGADFEEKEWELDQLKVRTRSFTSSSCLSVFSQSAWEQEKRWRAGS
jgi:hypothetical protein